MYIHCVRCMISVSGLWLCLRDDVLDLTTNWNRDCAVVAQEIICMVKCV